MELAKSSSEILLGREASGYVLTFSRLRGFKSLSCIDGKLAPFDCHKYKSAKAWSLPQAALPDQRFLLLQRI